MALLSFSSTHLLLFFSIILPMSLVKISMIIMVLQFPCFSSPWKIKKIGLFVQPFGKHFITIWLSTDVMC
jgi:hypothetical protein